ncbi:hypothetical protein F5Y03DRAFT_275370 [Xylaria venustula]|nr:hypothetical protein F5Y03DRAFT_275370 [Xylaria venustula]
MSSNKMAGNTTPEKKGNVEETATDTNATKAEETTATALSPNSSGSAASGPPPDLQEFRERLWMTETWTRSGQLSRSTRSEAIHADATRNIAAFEAAFPMTRRLSAFVRSLARTVVNLSTANSPTTSHPHPQNRNQNQSQGQSQSQSQSHSENQNQNQNQNPQWMEMLDLLRSEFEIGALRSRNEQTGHNETNLFFGVRCSPHMQIDFDKVRSLTETIFQHVYADQENRVLPPRIVFMIHERTDVELDLDDISTTYVRFGGTELAANDARRVDLMPDFRRCTRTCGMPEIPLRGLFWAHIGLHEAGNQ